MRRSEQLDIEPFVPRLLLLRDPDAPRQWQVAGSLLMVDLSGFTQLTDQLAERGRTGAEELTATLSRIFTLLLAASDDGGDVLKFGGDALLILYTGRDSAARACHAATSMQRVLRAVGPLQLTDARTTLRMSMGIHTGTFDFTLLGDAQRELFAIGAEVTTVLELEGTAQPGQIRISAATAAAVDHVGVEPTSDGAYFLRRAVLLPPTGALFRSRTYAGDIGELIPTAMRDRLDLFTEESEHRRAAIGFVFMKGTDAIVARDGLDAAAAAIDAVNRSIERVAAEFGVTYLATDVSPDGAKAILAAGIPDATEDPAGRLLRSLHEIVATDTPLKVQAGAAWGPVFVGPFGPTFRRTYTVMGDTVNLAARVGAHAQPGELLAELRVLGESDCAFDLGAIRPLALKGKPKPIEARAIERYVGPRHRQAAEVPFVGRVAERGTLDVAIQAVRGGASEVIDLAGEAGIGKTRLVESVVADLPLIRVQCTPDATQVPWRALRTLLRTALGISLDATPGEAGEQLQAFVARAAPKLERWTPLIAIPIDALVPDTEAARDLAPQYRQPRIHELVGKVLALAITAPTVLLLDDAHWMDESSADALAVMVERIRHRPVLVVATRREEAEPVLPSADLRLRLGPLTDADAQTLLEAAGGRDRRRGGVSLIQRSAGNPLFLLEMAASSAIDGDADLPGTVEMVIASRIDQLDVVTRSTLRCASVLGSTFSEDLFRTVAHDAGLRRDAIGPELQDFLLRSGDGEFTFRRDLYREVAYRRTSFRQRRELHRLAGEALSSAGLGEGTPQLSWHFFEAREWARARLHSEAAAGVAEATFAHDEAVVFLRRALESARRAHADRPILARLHERVGDAAERAADYDQADEAYQAARRLATAPVDRARLLERAGQLRERAARYSHALQLYSRARRMLEAVPPEETGALRARIDIAAAGVKYRQGRWAECMALCDRAIATATAIDDRAQLAHAWALFDIAIIEIDGPAGDRYGAAPLLEYEALGDVAKQADALINLGVRAYYRGDWPAAANLYRRGLEASQRVGDVVAAATCANNLGEILSDQGHLDEAEQQFVSARRTFGAVDYPVGVALVTSNLGRVARRAGNLDRAEELLTLAVDQFTAIGAGAFVLETQLRLIEVAFDRGAPGRVLAELAVLHAGSGMVGAAPTVMVMAARLEALARRATGDLAGASACGVAAMMTADEVGATYEWALTVVALAAAGDDRGLEALAEATRILRELGVMTEVSGQQSTLAV